MARKRSSSSSSRSSSRSSGGASRSTSSRRSDRAPAGAASAADDGMGIEGALGIATTAVLVLALLLLDYTLGKFLGKGMFFGG